MQKGGDPSPPWRLDPFVVMYVMCWFMGIPSIEIVSLRLRKWRNDHVDVPGSSLVPPQRHSTARQRTRFVPTSPHEPARGRGNPTKSSGTSASSRSPRSRCAWPIEQIGKAFSNRKGESSFPRASSKQTESKNDVAHVPSWSLEPALAHSAMKGSSTSS